MSYAFVAAKQIAKRGYKFVATDTIKQTVALVDSDSVAVLPFLYSHGQVVSTSTIDILVSLSTTDKSVYINKVVQVPLDYRLFFDKATYNLHDIQTIRIDEFASQFCTQILTSQLPFADNVQFKIVDENALFDSLSPNTAAVAHADNFSKRVSMSPTNLLVENASYTTFCVLTSVEKFDKQADVVFVSIKATELSVELMSILSILTMHDVELFSLNTICDTVILIFKGQVKQKKTIDFLNALKEVSKDLKVLGNI